MNDSLVEEQRAAQGPAHALSLAATCQDRAAQVWAGWKCQSQMGAVCPSQRISPSPRDWDGCAGAAPEGSKWDALGCGIRGSVLEGSRERLGERMTLLTPCYFMGRVPALGGLLEIM